MKIWLKEKLKFIVFRRSSNILTNVPGVLRQMKIATIPLWASESDKRFKSPLDVYTYFRGTEVAKRSVI